MQLPQPESLNPIRASTCSGFIPQRNEQRPPNQLNIICQVAWCPCQVVCLPAVTFCRLCGVGLYALVNYRSWVQVLIRAS